MSVRVAKILLDTKSVCIRPKEPFRFSSGLLSPIYCDHRRLLSFPKERKVVVEDLCAQAQSQEAQQIAGVATAGIPWGAWIAERLGLPFAYVRSKPKDHGAGKQIEGVLDPALSTLLVEDLISTGGSSLSAARSVQESGVEIAAILSIFTYQFSQADRDAKDANVRFVSTTTLDELLKVGVEEKFFDSTEAAKVLRWRENPKAWADSTATP